LSPHAVFVCVPLSTAFAVAFGVPPVAWQITAQAGGTGTTTSEAATSASTLAPTSSERFAAGPHGAWYDGAQFGLSAVHDSTTGLRLPILPPLAPLSRKGSREAPLPSPPRAAPSA
jgi:hypothetical protein